MLKLPHLSQPSEILPDPRDTRGKKHNLAFVVCGVAIAIMAGRATVSGIERFIRNRIAWLVELTGILDARPISRAHLPRLLARIDWYILNPIIEEYFGLRIERERSSRVDCCRW